MTKKKLVVLISGNGSNLQAIIDACQDGTLYAEVALVISNNPTAYGLVRAQQAGIPAQCLPLIKGVNRKMYDTYLAELISLYSPDYILLAGWMRILTHAFLKSFQNRVINIHPALPDQFPGLHAIERAFQAYQTGMINHTGVMIHFVPDEGVDNGPVIKKEIVPIHENDTIVSLEQNIHQTEHRLFIEALTPLCNQK
jgi:formyltetrahydrofolate-dependent phosphoribosylglycinamide formyltransferase